MGAFSFSFVIPYVSDFYSIHSSSLIALFLPRHSSGSALSPPQSANQDPISRGRLSRSSPQDTGNPPFPIHWKGFGGSGGGGSGGLKSALLSTTLTPNPGSNDGLHNKYWPTLLSAFDRKQHGIELLLWLFMHCCLLKVWPCPPALLLIFIDAIYSLQQYT